MEVTYEMIAFDLRSACGLHSYHLSPPLSILIVGNCFVRSEFVKGIHLMFAGVACCMRSSCCNRQGFRIQNLFSEVAGMTRFRI